MQRGEPAARLRDDHHAGPGVPHRLHQRAARLRREVAQGDGGNKSNYAVISLSSFPETLSFDCSWASKTETSAL